MNRFDFQTNPKFGRAIKIPKVWGFELISTNNRESNYCGKILHYNKKGAKSSFHLHPLLKAETFLVISGQFRFRYFDNQTGQKKEKILKLNDTVELNRGVPHQLEALEDNSEIFEVSTFDDQSDIIRIAPGDNQK